MDYAQTTSSWDSGYYYYDGSSRYGSYWFYYDEAHAQSLDASPDLHYIYRFEYQPKGVSGRPITVHFAPEGRSTSASGLYHHNDKTVSEKGYYSVIENGKSVEQGVYYYTRVPGKSGGYSGYLSEATFYYQFFPSKTVTSGRSWPNYRHLDAVAEGEEGEEGQLVENEKQGRQEPLHRRRRRRAAAVKA